jgi:apolipoprotein D and lipocalin family protein
MCSRPQNRAQAKKTGYGMKLILFLILICSVACSTTGNQVKTVEKVDINKFMGDWYVLAGRFTFLEKDVNNALERYSWNKDQQRIDVDFTYNKGSLTGPKKSIPQKAWIYNQDTNAHWKVSPLWPLKFDYLIIALGENYRWTAIGVPNQKYLWIMARDYKNPELVIDEAVKYLNQIQYNTNDLVRVPQQWSEKK